MAFSYFNGFPCVCHRCKKYTVCYIPHIALEGVVGTAAGMQPPSDPVMRAFYISSASTSAGAMRLQNALAKEAPFPTERWPAVMGGPRLLDSHRHYLERGVETHLLSRRCGKSPSVTCSVANISSWGQVGIYLSHITLLEHIATRLDDGTNRSVLILQDDAALQPSWHATLQRTTTHLRRSHPNWSRCLLMWFDLVGIMLTTHLTDTTGRGEASPSVNHSTP